MTRDEGTTMIRTPGDIYRYKPADLWCRHGLALVLVSGDIVDTYWYGIDYQSRPNGSYSGLLWHENHLSQLTPENYLGNLEDYRLVEWEQWQLYADSDVLHIPTGGGSEKWMVRKNASPDIGKSIEWTLEEMRKWIAMGRECVRKLEDLQKELDTLKELQSKQQ